MSVLGPTPVFNSLGSNYDQRFVVKSFQQLFRPDTSASQRLTSHLEAEFGGRAILVYKGRDAIQLALSLMSLANTQQDAKAHPNQVITQAFTCHAIEEGVTRAGFEPIFVDLAKNELNPGIQELEFARVSNPLANAVLMQHTLGVPADSAQIAAWCKEHDMFLVEDLASAVKGVDLDGVSLGSYGDVVILSFGRDKVWDAVSGGALILKNQKLIEVLDSKQGQDLVAGLERVPAAVRNRDLWYPFLTCQIRRWHRLGFGKLLFKLSKLFGWIRSPIASPIKTMARLPESHAALALYQLAGLEANVLHRRQTAELYDRLLPARLKCISKQQALASSEVRYPILVQNPDDLGMFLKLHGFFLTDRWYRQPVDSGNLNYPTRYQAASCPNAELLASSVFNLPTHQNITQDQARELVRLLLKYTNQKDEASLT